ncbi:Na+/melibiose symporter [Longilinea arvoryzae]|uniref:Na+/melibiose symporter n=1 Tax=Longilinea arvoryzae TaxID=360412 RepID=A0A0S7BBN3_9CHLR|nr:MFS transporter [Longilinea arvoryzae]GAP15070.1 Na+/melibiose symporter [Longilinea arvoryzae]
MTEDSQTVRRSFPTGWVNIAYGSLTLGSSLLWGVMSGWLMYFYLPPAGKGSAMVPLALFSGVQFVSRAINLLAPLPIGYLSDQTRTRWGRRLPYVLVASLLLPGLFLLLWVPPVAHESGWNLVYVGLILLLFNLAYSFRQIPLEALLPEIAPKNEQRVSISAWQSGFQMLGVVLTGFVGSFIEQVGYAGMAALYAGFAILCSVLPFLVLREQPNTHVPTEDRLDFWKSTRITLKNRPFQVFLISWGLFWFASTLMIEVIPYIVTELCGQPEANAMYFYLPPVIVSVFCYPLVTWLSQRKGKKLVFSISLLASGLILPLLALIGDGLPVPLLAQGILWMTLVAVAMTGAQVLPAAITADVTDFDQKMTGQRREGSYYAMWGVFDQLCSGLAVSLLPLLLLFGRSQLDPHGPLGVRLVGIVGGGLLIGAFLIFRKFPVLEGNEKD